jgi:hypothetical protein
MNVECKVLFLKEIKKNSVSRTHNSPLYTFHLPLKTLFWHACVWNDFCLYLQQKALENFLSKKLSTKTQIVDNH